MIKKLTCSTISEAPETPGLYAWYSKVDIGDSDYLRLILEGKDEGENRFRSLLARHTERHNLPDMHVRIHSSFESEWRATCAELTTKRFVETLNGKSVADDAEERLKENVASLDKSFAKQKSRKLFKLLLEQASPIFSSPLYIGVTDNLRRRLTDHVRLLQKLATALDKESERTEILRRAALKPDFGARALAAGFTENFLEIYIKDVGELVPGEYTDQELRDIAGSAEWVLNRWHKPYLGRR